MMSVVAGARATRLQAFLYALPMAAVAIAPWPLGLTGPIYGVAATVLSLFFVGLAARVGLSRVTDPALMTAERRLFAYSIVYLFADLRRARRRPAVVRLMPRHDPLPGPERPERPERPDRPPFDQTEIRRRQRSRSIATALILFGLVALFYAISIAKML